MINLDKFSIKIDCPNCGFFNPVTIKEIRLRDAIICRGCKSTINFDDSMNETRKTVREINRQLNEIMEQLGKMSKITIKF